MSSSKIRVLLSLPRKLVAMFDQEPVGPLLAFPLAHPGQNPAAVEFLALESEIQLAFSYDRCGVIAFPIAAIPNHDCAAAVLALRNGAFEVAVVQRMVFDLDREPLVMRIERRAFGDGPGFEDAIEFKPQVIMKVRCRMFLNDEAEPVCSLSILAFPLGSAVFEKSRLARYFASSFLAMCAPR